MIVCVQVCTSTIAFLVWDILAVLQLFGSEEDAHAGSGSSMCCVKGGKSIDTSMGMTPLEGCVVLPRLLIDDMTSAMTRLRIHGSIL